MFDRILIAKRGEIAVRVARTARRLGIATVAVYSDADADAMHVEACDQAFRIGPAAASDSYLNAERILEVARESGAQAIHPGYGFLSENAAFARACEEAGIVFIGPPAGAIEAMGSKSRAKALMQEAGVPMVPGYHGDAQDDARLAAESKKVGYPQLLKASAGGGGKGMRLVESEQDFAAALESARREASGAFGDDRMLIEGYLARPRHVEMQIFADRHGQCVHLFERDCSIQRRHQKILEEAPAPGIDDALRARMGAAAIECALAIDYVGAGTVEFLLDRDGSFYFMEMNTRLQVEHPVTEMITGQDLVEWQLRVAAGERLPLTQGQIEKRGHAFEARIYAENPAKDFMPAAGQIRYQSLPAARDGLRIDTGVREGDMIGINYDPMIAKLIVHAGDRGTALKKLALALVDYRILDLNTNIGFLTRLASMPELAAAEIDTGFIGKHAARLFAEDETARNLALVLAAAALLPQSEAGSVASVSPWDARDGWRSNLTAAHAVELEIETTRHRLSFVCVRGHWRCELNGRETRLEIERLDRHRLRARLGERVFEYAVVVTPATVALCFDGQVYRFDIPAADHGETGAAGDADHPRAPMSGAVVALPVAVGDTVEPGDTLAVIEAMKMEHAIVAQVNARVSETLFAVGDQVDEGETLVLLEIE